MNRHIFAVVSYIYSTREIGEWHIIRSNELRNTLQINCKGEVYYHEVPDISKC